MTKKKPVNLQGVVLTYIGFERKRDLGGREVLKFKFKKDGVGGDIPTYLWKKECGGHSFLYKVLVRLSGGLLRYQSFKDKFTGMELVECISAASLGKQYVCKGEVVGKSINKIIDFWWIEYIPEPASYSPAKSPFSNRPASKMIQPTEKD